MSRVFKFRVWDKKFRGKKKLCYPDENGDIFVRGVRMDLQCLTKQDTHWNDRYVFQQFTGLKDKNGKEVYEGDIVQLGHDTSDCHWSCLKAEVVWWLNGFYFRVKDGPIAQDTFYQIKQCEVIGNIFENPELI